MVYNTNNNSYTLSANKIREVAKSHFEGKETTLNLWEKFKDLFRANAKQEAIKDLLEKLNTIPNANGGSDIESFKLLKLLRDNARPEELSKFKFKISHNKDSGTWSHSIVIAGSEFNKHENISYKQLREQAALFALERAELAESITSTAVDAQKMTQNLSEDEVDGLRNDIKKIIDETIDKKDLTKIYDIPPGSTIQEADLKLIYKKLTDAKQIAAESNPRSLLANINVTYDDNPYKTKRALIINGRELINIDSQTPPLKEPVIRLKDLAQRNSSTHLIAHAGQSNQKPAAWEHVHVYIPGQRNTDEDGDEIPPPPPFSLKRINNPENLPPIPPLPLDDNNVPSPLQKPAAAKQTPPQMPLPPLPMGDE